MASTTSKRPAYQMERGAIDLVEEAVHLLRRAPIGILSAYYLGTMPFVLGFLYYWADMSRSAEAADYCAPAALGLAVLFIWMKCWQSFFAHRLMLSLQHAGDQPATLARSLRMLVIQTLVPASGLFVLPIALCLAFPFGWIYAFYQNITVLGHGQDIRLRDLLSRSWSQASLWPTANHLALAILFLFGLFVFINLGVAIFFIPDLLKDLLGVETVFTRSGWHLLNSTFLAATTALTYLAIDPLIKTFYTLRCFYGTAVASGLDLQVELDSYRSGVTTRSLILTGFLSLSLLLGAPAWAESANAQDNEAGVSPKVLIVGKKTAVPADDLQESLREVINRPEYSWRLPRERANDPLKKSGLVAEFFDWLQEQFRTIAKTIQDWLEALDQWLDSLWPQKERDRQAKVKPMDWASGPNIMWYVGLGVVATILVIVWWRLRKTRSAKLVMATAATMTTVPDLTNEDVLASDFSVSAWQALARELLGQGQARLAIRALYLGILARLAEFELIGLARYKSNDEYRLELARRSVTNQDIKTAFIENVQVFDRVWYGRSPAEPELVNDFIRNQERIWAALTAEYGLRPDGAGAGRPTETIARSGSPR